MARLDRCGRCNVARYCGRAHQVEHWRVHKHHCKRIRELKKEEAISVGVEAEETD